MKSKQKNRVRNVIVEEIYTCCAFCIAVSALPALALSYVVVRLSRHFWLKLLSSRYPHLEFITTDTVRSLLDTHRNQGIINVLLSVKGALNANQIRDQLMEHVINKCGKDGELMFPRLRHVLVSCWGNYAWDKNLPFRTENHFIVANAVYRGRQVRESNIQEYVSEIVSKYFPPDQSPWQYIIIPCVATEPKYYILIRVHHLLLSGKKSLNIGDLLMVEQLQASEAMDDQEIQQSPLTKLFPTLTAIPELWGKLNENMSNTWNEFVSEYDPLESPRALKTLPGVFHVAGLIIISGVSALRVLSKRSNGRELRTIESITAVTLLTAIQKECKRRNLTLTKIIVSPIVTADPRKWPRRTFATMITSTRMFFLLPFRVHEELMALIEFKNFGHAKRPNTLTWKYGELAHLCAKASGEAWRGCIEMYRAPSKLWTDTVRADDGQRHLLQTVSLCGRKVVSWSRPVPRAGIERAARALGVSCTDVALFAATDSLRAVFEQSHTNTPETILTTARAASEDFLFTFAEGQGKVYKKSQTGGMVCLSLPVGGTPRRISSVVEQACSRQWALAAAWAAQARYGALTRALPSPLARLSLNLLSRRYAVSYAEIYSPICAKQRTTLWGQTVDNVVYWRPPQANISMSLTVIQYGDTVRMSVMSDSRLSPAHIVPAIRWPTAIEQLVGKVDQEIARIGAQVRTVGTSETPRLEISRDVTETTSSPNTLKPPIQPATSPPPLRRRFTHN